MNDNYRPAVLDSIRWIHFLKALKETFMESVEAAVIRLIKENLSTGAQLPDPIAPAHNLINDLNCDSLDRVQIIMALEEEFNIEFADEEMVGEDVTVKDFITAVEAKKAKLENSSPARASV